MLIAGVDEAGRGSVLGPLVIAGISLDEDNIHELKKFGVRDSKLLSPTKRREIFREIKKVARRIVYEKIDPVKIDRVVSCGQRLRKLNYLEAQGMAKVLDRLDFDRAFVDCCDTNQERFGCLISDLIAMRRESSFTIGEKNPYTDMIYSEHHADKNHSVVAAASIVAKVTRDAAIDRLQKKHGKFGSGYPSDPHTISFLKRSFKESKIFPDFTRLSWLTVRRMQGLELGTQKQIQA